MSISRRKFLGWIGAAGLATTVVFLGIVRSGSAIGKAVIDPTHNSLIADYYPTAQIVALYQFGTANNVAAIEERGVPVATEHAAARRRLGLPGSAGDSEALGVERQRKRIVKDQLPGSDH